MAAGPASAEAPSEARIARLESDVAHLVTDVADIKADVRSLRDRVDAGNAKLAERIDAVSIQLNDGLKDSFAKARADRIRIAVRTRLPRPRLTAAACRQGGFRRVSGRFAALQGFAVFAARFCAYSTEAVTKAIVSVAGKRFV